MQHEMMRQPAPVYGSENVGDVLASIRRLIAQDEAPAPIPNHLLNALPRGTAMAVEEVTADITPETVAWATDAPTQGPAPEMPAAAEAQTEAQAEALPLILNTSDLIAPDFPDTAEEMPVEADLAPALDPEPIDTPVTATADMAPETVAEAAPEMALDPIPEVMILPELPEAAPASPAAMRLDFNLEALWADPPEMESPAHDWASIDTARTESPDLSTDNTASSPLNFMQTEENMLQANASVTPINANIDPHPLAEIEVPRDGGEPHLFAPQDKGAQKGAHLRGMIREAIRQELQGEIGNRLSRNLQQMIRHEIELTLRQMCEQE